jgi:dTDP-4-dehydrorhamnose reductase
LYEQNSIIIRTNIYGLNFPLRNTLVEWALKEWSNNKKINGFDDVIFNALYTNQLAEILKKLIEYKIDSRIINIGSLDFISKYDFLNKLRLKLGFDTNLLIRIKSTNFKSNIIRPKNTTLNLTKLAYIVDVPCIDHGIEKLVLKINKL